MTEEEIAREVNRLHQQAWYLRQKVLHGQVYLITFPDGSTYVGSTRNSLNKRRWHHNHHATAGKQSPVYQKMREYDNKYELECLHVCSPDEALLDVEQKYINELSPTLNSCDATRQPWKYRKGCVNGGVWLYDFFFPSKAVLHATLGLTPYGTFKSRLSRGFSLEQALGREPLKV